MERKLINWLRIAVIIFGIIVIVSFLSIDTNLIFRSLFIFGLLSGLIITKAPRISEKIFYLICILLLPVLSFLASAYHNSVQLKFNAILLLIPGIAMGSFLLGILVQKLRVHSSYKVAIIISVLLIYLSVLFSKTGQGFSAAAMVTCFVTGALVLSTLESPSRITLSVTFISTPILLYLVFSEAKGLLNVLPVLLSGSILAVIIIQKVRSLNKARIRLIILILVPGSIIIWLLQENYSNLVFSHQVQIQEHIPRYGSLTDKDNSAKVKVYLFWSAYCGHCRVEFPHFSALAAEYTNKKQVDFQAVFLTIKEKDSVTFKREVHNKYAFRWSKAIKSDTLQEYYRIKGVPHIMVIDNRGKVYFNGYTRIRPWIFTNRIQKTINNALEDNKLSKIWNQ